MGSLTEKNPKVLVEQYAGDNKLWTGNSLENEGQHMYAGKDTDYIKKTLRNILVQNEAECPSKVIILGQRWELNPFKESLESDKKGRWQGPVLVVVPGVIDENEINHRLGVWLIRHILKHRNTIRFLLLPQDTKGIYEDENLIYLSRCCFLCSHEGLGSDDNDRFRELFCEYESSLKKELEGKFSKFAILNKWDFQNTYNCKFYVEDVFSKGSDIPYNIEEKILKDLFDPELFREYIIDCAINKVYVGAVIAELTETPALKNEAIAIPYLGEARIIEEILKLAAAGDIMLRAKGAWVNIGRGGEDFAAALSYLKSLLPTSKLELLEIQLGLSRTNEGTDIIEIQKRVIS